MTNFSIASCTDLNKLFNCRFCEDCGKMEGNRDSQPPRFVYESRLRTRGNLTDPDAEVATWKRRQPPLLFAAKENRPDEIKRLIEKGRSVNIRNSCDQTALHMAASYGNPDCVRELLNDKSCEIDAQDAYGLTPLMTAVQGLQCKIDGSKECIKILCDNNANAMLTDGSGKTALHLALWGESHPEVLELLMKKMQ